MTILTKREKQVLYLLPGRKRKEVAKKLDISPHTVVKHADHIYRKLEVQSKTQAIVRGLELGELDLGSFK